MTKQEYSKGQLIFSEGAVEDCMYDIVSGSVSIIADYMKPGEKRITVINAGEFFGELGMIENMPRSATAIAHDNNTVINVIKSDEFKDYFKDKPEKVKAILSNTSCRIRALTKDYLDVCDTIAKYVSCEEKGEKVSPELLKKLKQIAGIKKKK